MVGDDILDVAIRKLLGGDPKDLGQRKNAIRAFLILGGFAVIVAALTVSLVIHN